MSTPPTLIPVLEVGGTHVSSAFVDPHDWSASRLSRHPLSASAPAEALIAELVAAADLLEAPPASPWAIAMPGPFDYQRGVARYAGVGKFDSLYDVDLRAALTERLLHRPGGITFINDASAFLLGEWLIGSARDADSCLGVTLGTGVGSAFLRAGRIVDAGPGVPPQAEVHLLVHAGRPLEDWVSRRAIIARYAELIGGDTALDVREIAGDARSGDGAARQVLDEAFTVLGQVLGPWAHTFGAELVLVGGSISAAWDLIEEPLRRGLAHAAPQSLLRRATGGEAASLAGAGYAAVSAS